jgi:CDP-glucose 4,6-dehydratase|tara:strand:+ start:1856 stop:2929 length:1074 start_codon:yes stop_codon:yes gene_type:complete
MVRVEMKISTQFWAGKRVLLTGHTGFKGAWLALWLHRLGAHVTGISLAPITTPNLFSLADIGSTIESYFCDIRDAEKFNNLIQKNQPDIVFHLAAQALVRESYANPVATFSSNVMGTVNLLDSLRTVKSVKVAVMITTDKVYQNKEWCWPYRETDELGGYDPYSASKAASEIVINSYRDAFLKEQGIVIASARAGNVMGGGDWSEDRLISDIVNAWQADELVTIRRPNAIRPWQHVLEPLSSYLKLAEQLWSKPHLAGAYNFGPDANEAATVKEVIDLAKASFTRGKVYFEEGTEGPHEAGLLTLDTSKARFTLAIKPRWNLKETVSRTMSWYEAQHQGQNARKLCESDIIAFEELS